MAGNLVLAACTTLALVACASGGVSPHPNLDPVWRDYLELPAERAMAIAGDPRRNRWVTGSTGGHATRTEAEDLAMHECQVHRRKRRLQAACVLYAVGDVIVWRGR